MNLYKLALIACLLISAKQMSFAQGADGNQQSVDDRRTLLQETSQEAFDQDIQDEINSDSGMLDTLILEDFKTKIYASLFNDIEYHSNGNFDGDSGEGSMLYKAHLQLYTTTNMPNDDFTLDTFTRISNYIYEGVDEQNRWGIYNSIYGKYRPNNNWMPDLFLGPEVFRYQSWDTGRRTTAAIGPAIGISDQLTLSYENKTYLYYLYKYTARFYQPGTFDHHSNHVYLALRQFFFKSKLMIEPYYSFIFYDYMHSNRDDLYHYAGLNISYRVTDEITLQLNGEWAENNSNLPDDVADFEDFSAGLNTSVTFRF